MAARAGVEPTTLQLKAIDSTKAPPCPTSGGQLSGVNGLEDNVLEHNKNVKMTTHPIEQVSAKDSFDEAVFFRTTAKLHYIEPQGTGVNGSIYPRFKIVTISPTIDN